MQFGHVPNVAAGERFVANRTAPFNSPKKMKSDLVILRLNSGEQGLMTFVDKTNFIINLPNSVCGLQNYCV